MSAPNVERVPIALPPCPVCDHESLTVNDTRQEDTRVAVAMCYCGSCASDVDVILRYDLEVIQTHTTQTAEAADRQAEGQA